MEQHGVMPVPNLGLLPPARASSRRPATCGRLAWRCGRPSRSAGSSPTPSCPTSRSSKTPASFSGTRAGR